MSTPVDPDLKLFTAINDRVAVLREFSETEPVKHLLQLLDLLRTSHLNDLANVTPETLQAKQGALRQVVALQRSLTESIGHSPKA